MSAGDDKKVRPLFLFALSRSGSTLLQRMLATHPGISTSAEPWLLLPLMDVIEHSGRTFSVYGHELATRAVMEFVDRLSNGRAELTRLIGEVALRLYANAADDKACFFLDKTPAYSLICRNIVDMFPDARFVWLVRHPLSVVASMIETFADGKWYVYRRFHELYLGLAELAACYEANRKAMAKVRYEDLLRDPDREMRTLYSFLGLSAEQADWDRFAEVKLDGRMKDPTGTKAYRALSGEPLTKWKETFGSPFRKAWARRYLDWIGRERLAMMGYDLDDILADLDGIPTRIHSMPGDIARHWYGLWRVRTQADVASMMRRLPKDRWGVLH
jgi:hypothetical protein